MPPLQVDPSPGTALAYVGTFLLVAGFYALTAHVAARWVLGETPFRAAVGVGVPLAAVTLGLRQFGPAVVVPLAVLVDAAAIEFVYDEDARITVLLTTVHVVVSVALGIALLNLVRLLS